MLHTQVETALVTENDLLGTKVVGIITDQDIAMTVWSHGSDALDRTVGTMVRGSLATIACGAPLADAITTMERENVQQLIVTGARGEPIGVVSIDDLIVSWADDTARLAQLLRRIQQRETTTQAGTPAPPPASRRGIRALSMDIQP